MKKTAVLEILETFDNEVSIEKLIEQLLFVGKVEKGLKDVEKGKVHSYEDVKQNFSARK